MSAVEVVSPAPREAWREVLAADPGATITQTPEWSDAIRSAVRAVDATKLYVLEDGRRLILPMMQREPLPGLVLKDSYPYGDLLASGGVRATDTACVLGELRSHERAARTRLMTNFGIAEQWAAGCPSGVRCQRRHVHVLELEGGFDRVWRERFQPSARRAVRKAERSGLTVQRDTSGDLTDTFYDVYREWSEERSRESGIPQWLEHRSVGGRREPLHLFQAVAAGLGDACRQWVAWRAGEPVAVMISLVHGDHALFWRGYSRKAVAGPLRANNLLQKFAIEDACAMGCRYYSMGQSGGVLGLERFKESLGAVPRPAAEYRLGRLPLRPLEVIKRWTLSGAATVLAASSAGRSSTSEHGPHPDGGGGPAASSR